MSHPPQGSDDPSRGSGGEHEIGPDRHQPGYGQHPQLPPYGPGAPPGYGAGPAPTQPRRSHKGLYAGLAALGLLLIAAVVLANLLGRTVLDRAAVERDVAAQFEEREGVAIDLSCDDDMQVDRGATYECAGTTADGEDVTLQIRIDAEDGSYTWSEP
jgi:hypothetical protein